MKTYELGTYWVMAAQQRRLFFKKTKICQIYYNYKIHKFHCAVQA